MESVSDWSGLIPDLLLQIASKLTILEDFMAIRGVCSSWRSCVTSDKFARVSKVPLLMLAENTHPREFYSLCKSRVCMRMTLPEEKGKRYLDAGFGWVMVAPRKNKDGRLSLVRMISWHQRIQLPDTSTFPGYAKFYGDHFLQRAVLSANPSETSDFVLMVSANNNLAFIKNGDNIWTRIDLKFDPNYPPSTNLHFKTLYPASICYHEQKFHIFDHIDQYLYVCDPSDTGHTIAILSLLSLTFIPCMRPYLVVSSKGELLLIMRNRLNDDDDTTNPFGAATFCVMKINIEKRMGKWMDSLDGDAIFIGLNSAVSVVADDLIRPNCIYFTDDYTEIFNPRSKGGMDMGIYNMEDGRTERFNVHSYSMVCPPVWIFPS